MLSALQARSQCNRHPFRVSSIPERDLAAQSLLGSMEALATCHATSRSQAAALLRELYLVERTTSNSIVPLPMQQRLTAKGHDVRAFTVQVSITISNRYVLAESLSYNAVRSHRFSASHASTSRASSEGTARTPGESTLAAELSGLECGQPRASDFCVPRNYTMADVAIGYLTSDSAVAFANMGRLTSLHGVVATRRFASPVRVPSSTPTALCQALPRLPLAHPSTRHPRTRSTCGP
jgi:hypothetical protein